MDMKRLLTLALLLASLMGFTSRSTAQGIKKDGKATEEQYEMKQYWMVFLKKGPHRDHDSVSVARLQEGHMANINKLAKEGKILVAGPFGDDGDLRGIFIMDCKDEAEVRRLCESDPAVKAGRLALEIHPWWTAKGGSFK
jgi:uncharacterized protein YciI